MTRWLSHSLSIFLTASIQTYWTRERKRGQGNFFNFFWGWHN